MKPSLVLIFYLMSYLSFGQEYISPRENMNATDFKEQIDAEELWSYDLVDLEVTSGFNDTLPAIVFFRNQPLKGNLFTKSYHRNYIPNVYFLIFPIEDLENIKEIAKDASSCTGPNTGGGYIILKSFVLYNVMPCISCSKNSQKKTPTDLCFGNIRRILEPIANQEFSDFKTLTEALPITRMNFETLVKEVRARN